MAGQASAVKLNNLIEKINKRFGDHTIVTASSAKFTKMDRLRTKIPKLNIDLGGGLPVGRFTRIIGDKSGGKTTQTLGIIALAQHDAAIDGREFNVLWADAEVDWDESWAKAQGVDTDKVTLIRTTSGQKIIDVSTLLLAENVYDMFVVDSIATMVPDQEVEESAEQQFMGLHAKLVNGAIRKWTVAIQESYRADRPLTIILINQLRSTMDKYDPESTPGGRGQDFASSLDIKFQRTYMLTDTGKKKTFGEMTDSKGDPVACISRYAIKKNKTGVAGRTGEFTFWIQDDGATGRKVGEVDCTQSLFDLGMKHGALAKPKMTEPYVIVSTGETLSTKKDEAIAMIASNKSIADQLEKDIIKVIEANEFYGQTSEVQGTGEQDRQQTEEKDI